MRAAMVATALAAVLAFAAPPATAADEFDKYALESVGVSLSSSQAGAHADLTTTFVLTRKEGLPYARTRDVEVRLPPGMIGNPQALPRCTVGELGNTPGESKCPFSSQVGVTQVRVIDPTAIIFTEPIYNLESPQGSDIVARLGFFAGLYPTFVNVRIDPTDYSVVAAIESAPSVAGLLEATTTLWGVPAEPSHDGLRLTPDEAVKGEFPLEGRPAGISPAPFLSNPTDCSMQRQVTITARSYQLPEQPSTMSAPFPQITGCGSVQFNPTLTVTPTNPEAFAPTGLEATLKLPQNETPQGNATSTLKSARVTLPAGFSINPAAADGLEACSAEEVHVGENVAAECPHAAKIGSIEAEVPALEETLHGSVYQRTPEPGRLFGFWVVADEQGVHMKLPAEIEANPLTGQITTVFDGIETLGGLPQVPVSALRLNVFGGPRAPLSTPACGTHQTSYSFAPWSGTAPVTGTTAMQITSGCGKGGFAPDLVAGMRSLRAGSFSPFTFTLTRSDGESNPAQLAVHLPQGLLAKLKGVPLCPEEATATGACPSESRIGSLTTAAGVGGAPLWIPQPGKAPTAAYLAGPYKGAPYSVVSVVPAQAGPFDFGLVVNRAAIHVDPETALATIATDPLPQILEGVPVSYRTIHVLIDRPRFTLNPTSCAAKKISATVTASNGAVATPSDGFQATNCARLRYTPKLTVAFNGETKRTGNPAVRAVLTQKPGQANTQAATVLLPRSQFIDNAHISNPCTRVQFAADECPKGSILGSTKAFSPLLDEPLVGKVYFRSNGSERDLPDIVADLKGPLRITLVGWIDSVKTGPETSRVRTRFRGVPDASVTRFVMSLHGGNRGLIENSRDLCQTKPRAEIRLAAHNGRVRVMRPLIGVRCGKD